MSLFNQLAQKQLGSSQSYAVFTDQFNPQLLVALPRSLAREEASLDMSKVVGYDVWHAHEATFLTHKGLPVGGTLKFMYTAKSDFIVESKSMKLYLNSFDMCKMGESVEEAIEAYEKQVKRDLETILKTSVDICFHQEGAYMNAYYPGQGYHNLYAFLAQRQQLETIIFDDYTMQRCHLTMDEERGYFDDLWYMHTLRSRCRITQQKDSGNAYVRIQSQDAKINPQSLLKHIVAMREREEFHEFCAERLCSDIMTFTPIKHCMVMLLFARRGSLDINPIRSSHESLIPEAFLNVRAYTQKTQMQ